MLNTTKLRNITCTLVEFRVYMSTNPNIPQRESESTSGY